MQRRTPLRRILFPTLILLGGATSPLPSVAQPKAPAQPELNEEEYAKDSSTEINVKNADIAAIVRIFSKKTKRNYILDEKVKGKVSIYLPGKVSAEESLRILDSVLTLKGFTAVPIGDNLWKIVPSKEARQTTIPTLMEEDSANPSSSVVTRLLQLKYVGAEDLQQILAQMISPDGLINAYTGTNSLILIDSEDNIQRLVRIVEQLDVPSTNRDMTIIPIKHADAVDVAQKLNEILGEGQKKGDSGASDLLRSRFGDAASFLSPTGLGSGANQQAGAGGGAPRPGGGARAVGAKPKEPKIIADERTNSIIVIADEETTARVRALVSQLDSKVDLSGSRFYVYRCQHANAEELAQVLASISGSGGGGTAGGGFGGGNSNSAGGFGGSQNQGGGLFGNNRSNRGGMNGQRQSSFGSSSSGFGGAGGGAGGGGLFGGGGGQGGGRRGSGQPTTAQLGENISITADPATNSLIIAAGKTDYEKIKSLLERLDVKRRQVLVESVILEVSIDKSMRVDTDFLGSAGGADGGLLVKSEFGAAANSLANLFSNPAQLQGFTLAAASAGSLKLPGGITIPTQSLLISAAERNENVNVLSSPTILATDNEQAQIIVGQNVPFLSSTSTNEANLNNTFNQIERQNVGITLRLTPQISSKDYVTLQTFTEVSALILATVDSRLGPTTRQRQSETTVIAKDGQMIVLGGLIADDVSESEEGVPFLKDIPVLGHMFQANSQAHSQTNLLIFLTPRIVKDQFDVRDVTVETRERLKDIIARNEVEPSRSSTLNSERIDNVAELSTYDGPKPGTIHAPDSYRKAARGAASESLARDTDTILDGSQTNADGVLELKVNPELPHSTGDPEGVEDISALPEIDSASRVGSLKHSASTRPAAESERFLVFRVTKGSDAELPLPFVDHNGQEFVGVSVPGDSAAVAKQFFAVGRSYAYKVGDESAEIEVQAAFDSRTEAAAAYPEVGKTWYTLSPYEIMNLGQGPWIAR